MQVKTWARRLGCAAVVLTAGAVDAALPSDFVKLECVQGDGSAYIDLGTKFTNLDTVEIDLMQCVAQVALAYGSRTSSSAADAHLWGFDSGSKSSMDFGSQSNGRIQFDQPNYYATVLHAVNGPAVRCVTIAATGVKIIESTTGTLTASFTTPQNVRLFDGSGTVWGTTKFKGRIYSFSVSTNDENGVAVKRMDLVPARRKSDSAVGFYDSEGETFFENVGSGSFTAGNCLQMDAITGNYSYTGSAITPSVTVRDLEGNVVDASDYTVTYANNVNAGIATATVTGTGTYAGGTASGTFRIHREAMTFTWVGTASGDWENAANWSPSTSYPMESGDVAVIPVTVDEGTVTVTVNDPLKIKSLSVGNQGESFAGKVSVCFKTGAVTNEFSESVTVRNNGVLTQYGPLATESQGVLIKTAAMSVESGGTVSVFGKGYTNGLGPGYGRDGARYAAWSYTQWNTTGRCYGSIRNPTNYGSSTYYVGCVGAGRIGLFVSGTLAVAGTITANGGTGNVCSSSGGSILIRCGELTGTGTITAQGGSNGEFSSSGGRIAIYTTAAVSGCFGGTITAMTAATHGSTAGTVYLEGSDDTAGEGTLIVDNGGNNSGYRTLLNDDVEGAFDPFGKVVVRNRGYLEIASGRTLKVTKGIACSSNGHIYSASDTTAIEIVGSDEATFTGGTLVDIRNLYCTNAPGKTIKFGTASADKWTIAKGKKLILKGAAGNLLKLRSATDGTRWPMCVNHNAALVDVAYVDVQDADASSGASVVAAHSTDSDNNLYWGFVPASAPGETITWTGNVSTDWENARNWSPDRTPTEDDVIVVPQVAAAKYPVIPAATYSFNRITVDAGATLTLNGCTATVTNDLAVAGTLAFAAGEALYVQDDVTVTGSVTPASGTIYVTGAGDQTLDFGDTTLYKIQFDKPSGNVSFGTHGFTATQFNCQATVAIAFSFHAGETYDFTQFLVNGISGEDRLITLQSDATGSKWLLKATSEGQNVGGVNAIDCDASGGDIVYAGLKSRQTDCIGWDTESDVAIWVGGTGDFTNPENWTSGTVPGPNTLVTVTAGDGVTLTATLAANNPITVKQLTVYAGTGGTATFAANSPITVRENVVIRSGGVLELNCFNDSGDAPNVVTGNVSIASGGKLSHTGPNSTETCKLHLRVKGTMTVASGGAVDVSKRGYKGGYGPGWVRCTPMYGANASGYCDGGSLAGKYCYGDIRRPVNYGSGADSGQPSNSAGCGAIRLEVEGDLQVAGSITAAVADSSAWAGTGGSVFLTCARLTGAGSVLAHGAHCTGDGSCNSSGGRIAIYQTGADDLSAFTGKMTTAKQNTWTTSSGTMYVQNRGDEEGQGTLTVENAGCNSSYATQFDPHMTGLDRPFGYVVVTNYGKLNLASGQTLKVSKGIRCASNGQILSADATTTIEFVGTNDAVFVGASSVAIKNLICTNVEKRIFFDTATAGTVKIPAGANLTLSGEDEDHPLSLLPLDGASSWKITVNADAVQDIAYVAVSNSNASAGNAVTAVDSHDLGGNQYWSFITPILPGEVIAWTGGAGTTAWAEPNNWDRKRTPVVSDEIHVYAVADAPYPTLGSGTYFFDVLKVGAGATLTLVGPTVTVSNKLDVAGSLVLSESAKVCLAKDADFTGGSVTAGSSRVILCGDGDQTVDLGGCTFDKVFADKPSGNVSFGTHGFTADVLRLNAQAALAVTFAAGATYSVRDLRANGLSGSDKLLSFVSSSAGTRWNLAVPAGGYAISGATVTDSAATEAAIAVNDSCASGGNNDRWTFGADTAEWIGGTGDFTSAANWSGGVVPTAATRVTLAVPEDTTITITVPAATNMAFGSLDLRAGESGKATLLAKGALTVAGDVAVGKNGVLTLNCYNDATDPTNKVGGSVTVAAGGLITHSGPNSTENAKVQLQVACDMTIEIGAAVDVSQKGYSDSCGPGAGGGFIGASHAGYGYGGAVPYGSILHPVAWGSATAQTIGGGAIRLLVGGTLRADGDILADGRGNATYSSAGGSVWIDCGTLVGSGLIAARDGLGGASSDNYASSGGRIAIYQRTARDFAAFPISRIKATYRGGQASGTVYLQSADTSRGADLHIIGGGWSSSQYTLVPMADDGDTAKSLRNVNLIVGKYAKVQIPSKATVTFRDIDLTDSTSVLSVNAAQVSIRTMRHKDGRRWKGTYDLGGTTVNPGRLLWVGGADSTAIFVR